MKRPWGFLIVGCSAFSSFAHGQSMGPPQRSVILTLAGPALSNSTAQEGILLAIPWKEFTTESYPRQDVRVAVRFWEGPDLEDAVLVSADAREKDYDPKYARFLLEKSGFYARARSIVLFATDSELRDGTYWLSKFLAGMDLPVDEPRFIDNRDEAREILRSLAAGDRVALWLRNP